MNDFDAKSQYVYRIQTGVLLLLNCPKFMNFGIDLSMWTIGEKFMGIKLIPEGTHFIYYTLKDEDYGLKQGFFININKDSKIHIRKYNEELQDFTSLNEEEDTNFKIGVNNLDFDAFLGNYPETQIFNWIDLTKYITQKTLDKLEPISKKYTTTSKEYEEDNLNLKGTIYYTAIPKRKLVDNLKKKELAGINQSENINLKELFNRELSKELTKINIDKSESLKEVLTNQYSMNYLELLGEFQYTFLTFFLGEVYESFEQWRNILILLLSCQEVIFHEEKLFCDFIEVLYHQFRQFPKDFFTDEISSNNFLSKLLTNFILYCKDRENNTPLTVTKRTILLEKFLKEYFNYQIKDENSKILEIYLNQRNDYEDDDELPVIIDPSELDKLTIS
jgi:A1 cistron-splicing factor AAR2